MGGNDEEVEMEGEKKGRGLLIPLLTPKEFEETRRTQNWNKGRKEKGGEKEVDLGGENETFKKAHRSTSAGSFSSTTVAPTYSCHCFLSSPSFFVRSSFLLSCLSLLYEAGQGCGWESELKKSVYLPCIGYVPLFPSRPRGR